MVRVFPPILLVLSFMTLPGNTRGQEEGWPSSLPQTAQIVTSYDAAKNQTTVRLAPSKISGERAHYHSLSYSVFYSHPGKIKPIPKKLSFELLTVVKRRLLKIDLYVVFLIDGEQIFLSSSRSAIKHPVPGKRWIGERLEFHMPYKTLLRITQARKLAVSLDGLMFDFAETDLQSLRDFTQAIKQSPSVAKFRSHEVSTTTLYLECGGKRSATPLWIGLVDIPSSPSQAATCFYPQKRPYS